MKKTRGLFCKCDSGVAYCHLQQQCLVNKYDIQSILHGLVSLAIVNHIYIFHEVMEDCNQIFIKDLL